MVVPIGGALTFNEHDDYPKILYNVRRRPLISYTIEALRRSFDDARIIFVMPEDVDRKFGISRILKFYGGADVGIIRIAGENQGAPCSILMAMERLDLSESFVVSSVDQVLDHALHKSIAYFEGQGATGGIYCFDSVHPKWSYARIIDDLVVEVREKTAISTNAIAGTYYFSSGQAMVEAFVKMIRRDSPINGRYFTAPAYNEIILAGGKVCAFPIDGEAYFNFYDRHQVELFERHVSESGGRVV